ncbi:MAG: glycosyltransferase [Cyanobacteria bacterium P01_F01_bin.4]
MPKVTVLMSVYNGEHYLRASIDSILFQSFKDFEFLIINDGSADSTLEIINTYDDSRIRLINNECNLGLTKSLNKGLKLARGKLIARQDGDDISEPDRLAKQVSFLEAHPKVALVGSWYKNIDPQGNLIGAYELPCESAQNRWEMLFCNPFIHSAVMFRKRPVACWIGSYLYDEAFVYAQDYALWGRIACRRKVANIGEYLVRLRLNPASMTNTYGETVDDEPRQIKLNHIKVFLSKKDFQLWSDGHLLESMTALWLAEPEALAEEIPKKLEDFYSYELDQLITQIRHLHKKFCQYYHLGQIERKKHYKEVCQHLSKRLMAIAHYYYYEDDDQETGQAIFAQACALKSSVGDINYGDAERHHEDIPFGIMT